jgi:hypothetical protein
VELEQLEQQEQLGQQEQLEQTVEAEAVVRYWLYQMPLLIQLYTIQQQGHMVL